MNLSGYTIEQLIELKNTIESMIYSYSDGYEYICKVRSYGRNWVERPKNTYEVQNLCYRYNGEDGIVDIYTTNPDLRVENYGENFYIESVEDYKKWKYLHDFEYLIKDVEEKITKWEDRENVPFKYRPLFEPIWTREELNEKKMEFDNMDKNFKEPKLIVWEA